jgi:hypothetical protein
MFVLGFGFMIYIYRPKACDHLLLFNYERVLVHIFGLLNYFVIGCMVVPNDTHFVHHPRDHGDIGPFPPADVAEPHKLYGPHAPVIVPKTSDGYVCTPDNLRRSVGCPHRTPIQLRLTTHTRINKRVTIILQCLYKTLHQSTGK